MNTSKQVNVMIGLLFLAFLVFGAYIVREPSRQASATEGQDELLEKRGAELFVANCRTCHGLTGKGSEEGAIAPPLNNPAFLILGEDNEYGVEPTAEGEARTIRQFLFDTISCGRTNSIMPVWSERHGGPLSETQINYLVDMITTGRWDLVEEIGAEHDAEAGTYPATVQMKPEDAGGAAATTGNCGQYSGKERQEIVGRDPFATPTPEGATPEPTATPSDQPEAQTMVEGVLVGEFFQANCAPCHGEQRQGLIGPALTPERLTESDEFYHDTIQHGRPGTAMPAWGDDRGLTDQDITNLVQFLKHVEP